MLQVSGDDIAVYLGYVECSYFRTREAKAALIACIEYANSGTSARMESCNEISIEEVKGQSRD